MESVRHYLEQAVERGVADLFLIAGKNITMKQGGTFQEASEERLMPKDSEVLVRELYDLAHRPIPENILEWDDDFALSLPGLARFRVNVFQQRGSLAAVIRIVKFGIPDWKEIGLTEEVRGLSKLTRGLALVTGPAGSGKSTTLACVVDAINRTRNAHIITIEDPIEYLHRNQMSIVSQRELAIDTVNYVTALRA
ncbi:MAG: Flp pilus assembly complex ATPase component TadA, partial [Oscillibacter sp.]|nr:Flp pilus assembly complex ATPase component TadA [Oscillibacter sp.]